MMYRSMFQVYVKNAAQAVQLYQEAFDAKVLVMAPSEDGQTIEHSELDVHGQVLAVSDTTTEPATGTTMQFCLHFGAGQEDMVRKAYTVLKEGATVAMPLAPIAWSPLMTDLTDRFGVRWCLFV